MRRITLILVVIFYSLGVKASHLMGGEITWECQPSGQFIFYMKLYKDCNSGSVNGLGTTNSITVHNHPTLTSITVNRLSVTDISPSCGGSGPNITCAGATGNTPGAVEEYLYVSDPITLSGIPPAQGWAFTWTSCCRNTAIDNLQNPAGAGMTLRAIMYPFNGQNTFPCFDSSPDFSEIPTAIVCAGGDFTYNHNASDRDLDSIAYKWANPLDNLTTWNPPTAPASVAFQSPYTMNSPLPGAPTLDVSTGEVAFNANLQGEFVTVIKVESWKCGQLISEVFREIQLVLTNCPANDPPDVSILDMSGNPITYFDTVSVGDVVQFQLKGVDVGQDVTLTSSSNQYGTNFANPNSGCINPPCAVLAPPPVTGSLTQSDSVTVMFNWATDCNHISYSDVCATASNTYTFVFNIQDDNCPAAGKSVATVAITVLAMPTIDPPELHCAAVNPVNGDVTLNWEIPLDTSSTFNSYHVYYATNPNGPYTIVDSIFNYNQTSYTHVGANADQQSVYYYMRSRSGCLGAVFTEQSDTLSTIDITPTFNPSNGTINVSWNELHNPLLPSSSTYYRIYKEYPIGSWNLLDSTQATSYVDTTTNCNDSITYWIEIDDDLTCTSSSNYGRIGYNNTPPIPDFSASSVCVNDTMFFTDLSSGTVGTVESWEWDFDDGNTDTLQNPTHVYTIAGTYDVQLIISTGIGCIDSVTKTVTVFGLPAPDAGIEDSICVFDTTQLSSIDPGWIDIAWGPNIGISDTTITNPDVYPTSTTNYIYYATDVNGCVGTDTVEIVVWGLPNPILADQEQFCIGDSVQIVAGGGDTYVWAPITDLNDPNIPDPYAQPSDTMEYFVTITDGNGCSNNDSITVIVNPLPLVDAGLSRQICIGDTTELIASGGDIYVWTPTDSLSRADSSHTFAWPIDTTWYFVEVTDSNGCVNVDSVEITVNPLPVVTVGLDRQICIGDTTELIATGGELYSWTPTTNLSTPTNDSTLAWPTDTTKYIVQVTDSNACVNYDSILVIVNPLPVVDAGSMVQICIGDTTELISTGGNLYSWTPTDSLSNPMNDSTFVWPTDTTEYFVQVTDSNGCINIDSVTVIVNPLPVVDAGLSRQICIGDTTELIASGGDIYAWTPTDSLSRADSSHTFAWPTDTTWYIVEATDSNGCVNIDSVEITVNPLPVVTVGLDRQICIGDTTELIATGGELYSWTSTTNLLTPNNDSTLAWPTDTTKYIVQVTDSNACVNYDSILVIVNPLPVVDAGPMVQICIGDTTELIATGGDLYSWTPIDSLSNPINDSTFAWPTDTTEYFVQVTDSHGCVNIDSVTVIVNPLPVVDAGLDRQICINDTTTLMATGGDIYDWTPNDGSLSSPSSNVTFAYPTDTTMYYVQVTDSNGCVNVDSVEITVNPLPVITTGVDRQICIGDTTELIATGGNQYSWLPIDSLSNPSNDSTFAWPTDTTNYIVEVTDSNSCVNFDSILVVVNPLPIVDAGLDRQICIGDSTELIATGGELYSWTPTDSLSNPMNDSTFAWPTDTTLYSLEITDSNGCVSYASVEITVNPLPIVDAGLDRQICINDTTTLIATGGNIYDWTPNDGSLSSPSSNVTYAYPIDTTIYQVQVTDSNGCVKVDSVLIIVNPLPLANAGYDIQICIGDTVMLVASGGDTYLWTPNDSLNSTTNDTVYSWVTDTTQYVVAVTDTNACMLSDTVSVIVNPLPVVDLGPDLYLCPSDTLLLIAGGGSIYNWLVTDSLGSPNNDSTLIWPSDTTEYIVEVTDTNGCVFWDSIIVDVNPVVPTDAGPDTSLCVFDSIMIGGTPTAPLGTTYSWNTSLGMSDTSLANPMVSPSDTITYWVNTLNHICNGVDTVVVVVHQLPFVDAGPNIQICIGDSTEIIATGGVDYVWSPIDSLSGSNNDTAMVWPTDTSMYHVQVTDMFGCVNYDSTTIIVNPLPIVDAGPNVQICIEDSALLVATGGLNYSWSPTDSLATPNNDSTWAYPTDTTEYFVEVTDSNGCVNFDSVVVTVNPFPIVDAGLNHQICIGETTTLIATGGDIFVWTSTDTVTLASNDTIIVSPNDTVTYYVQVTDSNSCISGDSVIVTVNPLPIVDAGSNVQICIGDSTQLIATGGETYSWIPITNNSDPNNDTTTVWPTDTTTYQVTAIDSNLCQNTDVVTVIVNPLPIVDAGSDTISCRDGEVLLGGSPTGPLGADLLWSPTETMDDSTQANPTVYTSFTTVYTVIVTDTNNCVNYDSTTVNIFSIYTIEDTVMCEREMIDLFAGTISGISPYSYDWSPIEDLEYPDSSVTLATPPTSTTYTVTVTDGNGCIEVATVELSVRDAPEANFNIEYTPLCEEVVIQFENVSESTTEYFWSFGDGFTSTEIEPEHSVSYEEEVNITLMTYNEFCGDTVVYKYTLDDFSAYLDLGQNQVFSPNGDGVNDVFSVEVNEGMEECTNIVIFNRWGIKVFESTETDKFWNGTDMSGDSVPAGVYFYVFTIGEFTVNSSVTVFY